MHLDKYLIKSGYGTKEIVHKIIKENNVYVNSSLINDFHYELEVSDIVSVNTKIKKYKEYHYIILNKPEGLVSSSKDNDNETIFSLLPKEYSLLHLNIVGRLDKDVKGLILLTNNNKLFKYLINPNNNVTKEYLVTYSGNSKFIDQDISKGVLLDNGYKTHPISLNIIDDNKAIIKINEGKFHEVKNIFLALHMKVIELKRLKIGPLNLGDLKEKEYRKLTNEEINSLLSLLLKED